MPRKVSSAKDMVRVYLTMFNIGDIGNIVILLFSVDIFFIEYFWRLLIFNIIFVCTEDN